MAASYFVAIQDEFTLLRGTPFLLASTDFTISESWHQGGIPLAVVLEAMATVLEGREPDAQPVRGLKIVDRAVWKAWQLLGGSSEPPVQQAERIPELAAAVRKARVANTDTIVRRLEQLATLESADEVAQLEDQLRQLDARLLVAGGEELGASWLSNQRRRAERVLAPMRSRISSQQWDSARDNWVNESIRESLLLPRLSLF